MSDFWDNLVPLAGIALVGFLIFGLGLIIMNDTEKGQLRYEQCIAADKQWVQGNCVK
jgi:hypothetical protein